MQTLALSSLAGVVGVVGNEGSDETQSWAGKSISTHPFPRQTDDETRSSTLKKHNQNPVQQPRLVRGFTFLGFSYLWSTFVWKH